jgi:RNA polymerase sigma factor (sigma-70 family)
MNERQLLETARGGDQDAFAQLMEPHRGALLAHCDRMLASVPDAKDALRDALLRAWRRLARFEGRSSLRSWLYTIATNASLRTIERRPKRVLPIDYAPAAGPHDGLGEPPIGMDQHPFEGRPACGRPGRARERRAAYARDGTLVAAICPRLMDTDASRPWFEDMPAAQTPAEAAEAPLRVALDCAAEARALRTSGSSSAG